jgi:fatty acid desaturase
VSESDRLSKGFVNWQGQRVFVPWFGAPRIVPTTDSEVRVLKVRFRLDIAIAMAIIPFCAIGVWLGNPWGFVAAVLAVSIVVGSGVLLQHRHVRQWPRLMTVKFARLRFMLGYFRSLRIMERVNASAGAGWDSSTVCRCFC